MSENINRLKDIFFGVIPKEGTDAYKKLEKQNQERIAKDPAYKKWLKDSLEKATKTCAVQNANGTDMEVDKDLRYFLREFNQRVISTGLRSMPMLFNIMQAFFDYDKSIVYFELCEEEDYLISLFDFIDHYTSNSFEGDIHSIRKDINEDLVYNYNVGADLSELTFKNDESKGYVIGGISLVRRSNEVTVMIQAGEEIEDDTEDILYARDLDKLVETPGKEGMFDLDNADYSRVLLHNDPAYHKVLVICRFDLENETLDGRFVAKERKQGFELTTDEIHGFLNKGEFISDLHKKGYEQCLADIELYNPLFELAKTLLHMPSYFNKFEEQIISEDHPTQFKDMVRSPIAKRNFDVVENKFKILSRTLFVLNTNDKFSPDRIDILDSNFKIETSGYWKTLSTGEYGMDKNRKQISGKTWVVIKESYYRGTMTPVTVTPSKRKIFTGPNAGLIYVMRSPQLPKDTYKIGLTTGTAKDRSGQLSKTSIPDRHYVMRQWETWDCKAAESEIHNRLESYRVDPRREFFQLDMETINSTIEEVVNRINEQADS